MILTLEQARRKTVEACQAALTKRGVAVLVVPADLANAASRDAPPYAIHARRPVIRPSDADLDEIAAILNKSEAITIYLGAGCAGAHDDALLPFRWAWHNRASACSPRRGSAPRLLWRFS
jgi:pyruvate dehydrogenase (quinone)